MRESAIGIRDSAKRFMTMVKLLWEMLYSIFMGMNTASVGA
jgi:hypothetical protein